MKKLPFSICPQTLIPYPSILAATSLPPAPIPVRIGSHPLPHRRRQRIWGLVLRAPALSSIRNVTAGTSLNSCAATASPSSSGGAAPLPLSQTSPRKASLRQLRCRPTAHGAPCRRRGSAPTSSPTAAAAPSNRRWPFTTSGRSRGFLRTGEGPSHTSDGSGGSSLWQRGPSLRDVTAHVKSRCLPFRIGINLGDS